MNSVAGFETNQRNLAASATFDSGGAYQTALGTNNDVFQWSQIRNGSSDQSINITVNDATGVTHSLDVTLRDDSIARNARSLDEALATINTALQQSGDSTLMQIVAVKEQTYAGDGEGIRFLSKLSGFRVTAGQVGDSTAASEVGIYDATTGSSVLGQGAHVTSELAAGGSQVDISNSDTAKTAVTALAAAVTALGNAQAVVGKGQNQFNYAVNLASTQLSNLAASESRIRDADLASEAANLTKAQILLQAGIAAMAQANSAPQAVLSLLRG
jgi:flagellin